MWVQQIKILALHKTELGSIPCTALGPRAPPGLIFEHRIRREGVREGEKEGRRKEGKTSCINITTIQFQSLFSTPHSFTATPNSPFLSTLKHLSLSTSLDFPAGFTHHPDYQKCNHSGLCSISHLCMYKVHSCCFSVWPSEGPSKSRAALCASSQQLASVWEVLASDLL